jgi:hypothetical protein
LVAAAVNRSSSSTTPTARTASSPAWPTDFEGFYHFTSANVEETQATAPDAGGAYAIAPRYLTRDLPIVPTETASQTSWTILDTDGGPVSVTGNLRLVAVSIDDDDDEDCDNELFDVTLTPAFSYETGAGLTVGGDDNNVITLTHDTTKTATAGTFRYFLWDVDNDIPLARGRMPIIPSAKEAVA